MNTQCLPVERGEEAVSLGNEGIATRQRAGFAEEWERVLLGRIARTYGGLTGKTKSDFGDGTAKYVSFLDVLENVVLTPQRFDRVRVSPSESQNPVGVGDVLFNATSETPEDLAMGSVVGFDSTEPLYLNSFCFGVRIVAPERCDPLFLAYLSRGAPGRRVMYALAQGATRYNLSTRRFLGLRLPLPPLPEQRAIAAVLSDVDGLIGSLEALVAKKRAIKRAAMQQLLTGRTRLPGFEGEWKAVSLGVLAEIRNGGTPSTTVPDYWDGDIPWCTPTDITRTSGKELVATARSITSSGLDSCGGSLLPAGALLLCSRATIGELKIAAMPVATNQGFKSLVCGGSVNHEYLYYRLLPLKDEMAGLATGSTFLEISKRDVASIRIHLPQLAEQRAIAAVLTDMDDEIAALERRLDKTRAIKQGMMQQLLTGAVRLPIPDDGLEGASHGA